MSSRRTFLKTSALAGAGALILRGRAWPFEQSPTNLRKFIIGLPGLGPTAKNEIGQYIPVAYADTSKFPGSNYYRITAGQYTEQLHPDLPKATTLWGYGDAGDPNTQNGPIFRYLGPLIVASNGTPSRLLVKNSLPAKHILPVDTSAFFSDAQQRQNAMCVHLHGGFVPWISDGGPMSWFTPGGGYGVDNYFVPDMPKPQKGCFTYYYPNQQSARLMWYHDHAHDLTRINAYAGLASGYLLTDAYETKLVNAGIIPSTQFPLIVQDKGFKSTADKWGLPGDLWYPSIYEGPPAQNIPSMRYSDVAGCSVSNQSDPCGTGRWDGPVEGGPPLPVPSCVPEAFFDTILVNGAVFPYASVQGKRYRFRILNGSQARFYNLQLYVRDNSAEGITLASTGEIDPNGNPILAPTNPDGPAFIQIGTEGGFLPAPVVFSKGGNVNSNRVMGFDPITGNATRFNLVLAPAERADIIVDFRGFEGRTLVLYGDAPGPFPGGDIRNDYYAGAPDLTGIGGAPSPKPGMSPNTRTLMVFKVGGTAADSLDFNTTVSMLQSNLPTAFNSTQPSPLAIPGVTSVPPGIRVRQLTLNEDVDQYGRLLQRLGTMDGAMFYMDTPTETPHVGDTEVWQIFNNTADTHPIHFHLVNVQVISRAPFVDPQHIGTPYPPDPNEAGWKETVRMNPGEVTTVIMKFVLPTVPFTVPLSTWTGVKGHEYVWHCHILEHEEHDMMRPLIVQP